MNVYFRANRSLFKWFILVVVASGWRCGELTLPLDPKTEKSDRYCSETTGTTYYVRSDGGTSTQCTGTENAPYPGTGEGRACAFVHPSYAFPPTGTSVLAPGDRLVIGQGEYPINVACNAKTPEECALSAVPSGIDVSHPTCVVGEGWKDGCKKPPVLTGIGHVPWLLNLQDASFVTAGCLELTDAAPCVTDHPKDKSSCNALIEDPDAPVGLDGIFATGSEYVTLKDISIHGLARFGIYGKELADWTLQNVHVTANGNGGIVVMGAGCDRLIQMMKDEVNHCKELGLPAEECVFPDESVGIEGVWENTGEELNDLFTRCRELGRPEAWCTELETEFDRCMTTEMADEPAPSNSGEIHLTGVSATMNGCGELNGDIVNCFSSNYSSGLMVQNSTADWVISSSTFSHNTRDGVSIDLVEAVQSVRIDQTRLEGNAGTQMTVLGNATIINTIVAGDCGYFEDHPSGSLVESCREGGITMQFELSLFDERVEMANDTIWGNGIALTSILPKEESNESLDTDSSILPIPSFMVVNTIFSGSEQESEPPSLFASAPSAEMMLLTNNNLFYQVKDNELDLCNLDGNLCEDPQFVSTNSGVGYEMDLNLLPSSPAIDHGLSVGAHDLVPDTDFWNNPRPSGDAVDVGAVEYQIE